ncbi:MAG: hypothetical protein QOH06_1648 [Acidobacteriota bacterium]|nr:hypothetical protein [Acidobacteriota bacterium]
MGLRYRDLMTHVMVECMAGPAPECAGCTQSAREPDCAKGSQNPNPRPNCPKPSAGGKPPKKRLDGLAELREQLRAELRA